MTIIHAGRPDGRRRKGGEAKQTGAVCTRRQGGCQWGPSRGTIDGRPCQPFFAISVFTSSIASVKRLLSRDSASWFDFWMRSATSFMLATAFS